MAVYSSNIISLGNPGKYGVYPQWVWGYVNIPITTTLLTTDTINLCLIPANTILVPAFVIDLPDLDSSTGLTLNLQDNVSSSSTCASPTGTAVTSPNVYVAASSTGQAGGLITAANLAHGLIGTTYGTQQILQLVPAVSASGATAGAGVIYFGFSFAPL